MSVSPEISNGKPKKNGTASASQKTASASQKDDTQRQVRTAPVPDDTEDLVKYLLVELDVKRENHEEFRKEMHHLTEVMFDRFKWELVFAAYPLAGVVNRFVHIWKIPDESTVLQVMRVGAVSEKPSVNATALDKEFKEVYSTVQKLIERTNHVLMTSLPYDPEHVGYQSQAIVIDKDGEAFLIEREDLVGAAGTEREGFTELTAPLAYARRLKRRERVDGKKVQPEISEQVAEAKEAFDENSHLLKTLERHLSRGTTVARLGETTAEGDSQMAVFNLAGLKPKSVYQSTKAARRLLGEKGPKGAGATEDGIVQLPEGIKSVCIAAPWGAVYKLDQEALTQLAREIPAKARAQTKRALSPLVSGGVPLAAIPEERDDIIGDGCACYVINLNSFVEKTPKVKCKVSGGTPV